MANSGNMYTGESNGRSIRFDWWINSQNISENYTDIGWQLVGDGSYTGTNNQGWVYCGPYDLWIAGTQFYSSSRTKVKKGDVVFSGTHRLYHDSSGNCSFTAAMSCAVYSSSLNVSSGDHSWSLPTIARAPSYTSINATNVTEHTVRLTAGINTQGLSITGGGWDISTNSGSTWTYYSGSQTDKTITGLKSGTQYWYRGYVTTAGGKANSQWGTFTTKDCVVRSKINGAWKKGVPYVRVNGAWKKGVPYIKVNGAWKEGIN